MTPPYIIIESDSEDEDDYPRTIIEIVDSDFEEDPEEELDIKPEKKTVPETPSQKPTTHTVNNTTTPISTFHVGSTSTFHVGSTSNPTVEPVIDIPVDPISLKPIIDTSTNPESRYLREHLQQWWDEEDLPTIPLGSPTRNLHFPITHEPPYRTTAILAARVIRIEDRLDHVDDNLAEVAGPETIEQVWDQFNELEGQIQTVRDEVQVARNDIQTARNDIHQVGQHSIDNDMRVSDLAHRMDYMERRLAQMFGLIRPIKGEAHYTLGGQPSHK